jgi:hypothetical protein
VDYVKSAVESAILNDFWPVCFFQYAKKCPINPALYVGERLFQVKKHGFPDPLYSSQGTWLILSRYSFIGDFGSNSRAAIGRPTCFSKQLGAAAYQIWLFLMFSMHIIIR